MSAVPRAAFSEVLDGMSKYPDIVNTVAEAAEWVSDHGLSVGQLSSVVSPSTRAIVFSLNGKTYHPQDEAYYSWFAHQSPSKALHHQYSYISPSKLKSPPPHCQ